MNLSFSTDLKMRYYTMYPYWYLKNLFPSVTHHTWKCLDILAYDSTVCPSAQLEGHDPDTKAIEHIGIPL